MGLGNFTPSDFDARLNETLKVACPPDQIRGQDLPYVLGLAVQRGVDDRDVSVGQVANILMRQFNYCPQLCMVASGFVAM